MSELAKQTVSSNTGSDESLDIASQWILECISNHKHCNRAAKPTNVETPLPTRLLYIGTLGDQSVRLCNTKLLPDDTQYMTLSHCWGQLQLTTLTNSNIATFQEGLATSKLPKTFRDAIYVAQKMSVQYIWIDSLCIIQDAEDDWTKESAHMMSVYAGAFCNIAATAAPDARTGLFFDRDVSIPRARVLEIPPRPVCPPFQSFLIKLFRSLKAIPKATVNRMVRKGWFKSKASFHLDLQNVPFFETGKYSIEGLGLYGRDLHTSPLMKRAWVLQEQLLAKRTLHFTSTQVYFGCQEQ